MTTATAVRERGILYSGAMVRSIIADLKRQTRRVVKLDPWMVRAGMSLEGAWVDPGLGGGAYLKVPGPDGTAHRLRCPHGDIGDRLWVREAWTADTTPDAARAISADEFEGSLWWHEVPLPYRGQENAAYIYYRADNAIVHAGASDVAWQYRVSSWEPDADELEGLKWTPGIHMPRWAARIVLEITDVRVERLQDISASDCYDEGVRTVPSDQKAAFLPGTDIYEVRGSADERYRGVYRQLWDSINGKRAPWASNPFVWVISFRQVTP